MWKVVTKPFIILSLPTSHINNLYLFRFFLPSSKYTEEHFALFFNGFLKRVLILPFVYLTSDGILQVSDAKRTTV